MTQNSEQMKINAAKAALKYVSPDSVLGIGTGSTVNLFIRELASLRGQIAGTVSSSEASTKLLRELQIPVLDFNAVDDLAIYFDGADSFNVHKQLVKGGGGALTREKILAYAAKQFICLVDATKSPGILGSFPVPIEVIPMARSYVAREIVKLGGKPEYRSGFVTDNGNVILDVHGWQIAQPIELEQKLNQITGIVCNGIFAVRSADHIIIGSTDGASEL